MSRLGETGSRRDPDGILEVNRPSGFILLSHTMRVWVEVVEMRVGVCLFLRTSSDSCLGGLLQKSFTM